MKNPGKNPENLGKSFFLEKIALLSNVYDHKNIPYLKSFNYLVSGVFEQTSDESPYTKKSSLNQVMKENFANLWVGMFRHLALHCSGQFVAVIKVVAILLNK